MILSRGDRERGNGFYRLSEATIVVVELLMRFKAMEVSKNGKYILLGTLKHDPFVVPDEWQAIRDEAESRFPEVDLIVYNVEGSYKCLASLSHSLDPMALAVELMPKGIMCMGSNMKVNLMTDQELSEFIDGLDPQ